jgi:F0F1-type ATP synthase assembly protein I
LKPSQASPLPKAKGRQGAFEVVFIQAIFTGLLALIALLFGKPVAMAVLIGGAISSLANSWIAVIAIRSSRYKSPQQTLVAGYLAEVGKFIIVALLFVFAFKKLTLFSACEYAFLMLAGFLTVQMVVLIYPLVRKHMFAILEVFNRR